MATDTPPCAELHLHIEGTLEVPMVLELAERNGIALPTPDAAALRRRYEFTDLQSFLDLYYENMAVLRTPEDFESLTAAYLRRAAAGGVMHAEIMFDPQAHLIRGVPLGAVVEGIAAALAAAEDELGVTTDLFAAFLRDRPAAEADAVLTELLALRAPIAGIGLDSAEVGHPPSLFVDLFARAGALGLHRIAHAGEEGPAVFVRDSLDLLHAERIDHGIRSVEDPALVERLVRDRVPLTVCPLSNVRLHAVPSLAEHPLPRMLAAGLNVCVNSDDPAYFGGYVDDNFAAVRDAFGLDADALATLAANSVDGAFASPARKDELREAIVQWRAGVSTRFSTNA
ncbi:MAG: adenosine deaminase [Actinomycetales bacterium]|nr:adenosine deaminase [Actinomycetales bacterium]